jgi:prepilin-type N-terminal cleavage/methylation domain-containing protein
VSPAAILHPGRAGRRAARPAPALPSAPTTRGFTLVEVLVATTVLLVGLTGLAGLLTRATVEAVQARRTSQAQFVAASILDRLRMEVRFDAAPTGAGCGGATNHGCAGDEAFAPENAWRAERLPYGGDDVVAGAAVGCNPAGANDGQSYDVGPFPLRHQGIEFLVCYRLAPTTVTAAVPPHSQDAHVKVLWRRSDSYSALWVSSVLVAGS